MKKILILLFMIGFSLGISQLFYVRHIPNVNADAQRTMARCEAITPMCMVTLDTINIRGFPLTSSSTYYNADTPTTLALLANILILTTALPATGYASYTVRNRLVK